jgi:hypothetical protein
MDGPVIPASENLHRTRNERTQYFNATRHLSKGGQTPDITSNRPFVERSQCHPLYYLNATFCKRDRHFCAGWKYLKSGGA